MFPKRTQIHPLSSFNNGYIFLDFHTKKGLLSHLRQVLASETPVLHCTTKINIDPLVDHFDLGLLKGSFFKKHKKVTD
jgi:hypothetical protein